MSNEAKRTGWTSAHQPHVVLAALGILTVCVVLFLAQLAGLALLFALALALIAMLPWLIFRHPTRVLGAYLALIPIQYLAVELPRFYGVPYMTLVSAGADLALLLATAALWRRNGFRPTAADWFLLAFVGQGAVYTLFGGSLLYAKGEFMWLLPYVAGRVAALPLDQEHSWAKRGVWIVAGLSLIGMVEVFILGPAPRTLLYTTLTDERVLGDSAFASGYSGIREFSTMPGPLDFGGLCMVVLVIWWVYFRRPVPAAAVAAGLALSVTRSAWVGAAVAIVVLGIRLKQKKRLIIYGVLAVAAVIALGPALGFTTDYFRTAFSGQEPSTQGHVASLGSGLSYLGEHPFGTGLGSVGWDTLERNANVPHFESTYLQLGGEFGISCLFCFLAFLLCALRLAWQNRTQVGYAAVGVIVAYSIMMALLPMQGHFQLGCWIWFPVGLAVRQGGCRHGAVARAASGPETCGGPAGIAAPAGAQ